MVRDINWHLIALASLLPLPAALAIAWPFWKTGRVIVGNTVGVGVVFIACIFFGAAEYADALKFRFWCGETGTPCAPTGSSDFLRLATFGVIAMAQAALVYVVSADVEQRRERLHYEARWR